MGAAVGFPDDFYPEDRGSKRNEKRKEEVVDERLEAIAFQFELEGGAGEGFHPIQKLVELLAVIWGKLLELEQKLVAAIENMMSRPQLETELPATLFNTTQAARKVGLKRETVEKYIREGKLLAVRVPGRGKYGEYRIDEEELVRFKEKGPRRRKPPRYNTETDSWE